QARGRAGEVVLRPGRRQGRAVEEGRADRLRGQPRQGRGPLRGVPVGVPELRRAETAGEDLRAAGRQEVRRLQAAGGGREVTSEEEGLESGDSSPLLAPAKSGDESPHSKRARQNTPRYHP